MMIKTNVITAVLIVSLVINSMAYQWIRRRLTFNHNFRCDFATLFYDRF